MWDLEQNEGAKTMPSTYPSQPSTSLPSSRWIRRSGILLCYPFENKRLLKWKPPYLVQPKLDGERMRAILDSNGRCNLLSSEENEIISLPHIKDTLERSNLRNIELDGEAYLHGLTFEDIHSIVSRKVNIHSEYWRMDYHIFDIINSDPQLKRLADLSSMFETELNQTCLKLVPTYDTHYIEEIMELKEEFSLQGYEGIIVRNFMAPYIRRRSTNVMKFKPKKRDYYTIIGFQEEIDQYEVPKGRLGAFICVGDDGTEFNVGSGSALTHENRQLYWDNREDLIGSTVLVEYQHLTPGRGAPRFPVLVEVLEGGRELWEG